MPHLVDEPTTIPPPGSLTLGQWVATLTPAQLWKIGVSLCAALAAAATVGGWISTTRSQSTTSTVSSASASHQVQSPTQGSPGGPWGAGDFPAFLLGPWRVQTKGPATFDFEMVIAPNPDGPEPSRFVGAMYTPASTDGKPQLSVVEGKITARDSSTATIEFTRTYVNRGKADLVVPQMFRGTVIDGNVPIMKGKFNTFGRPLEFEWSGSRSAG